MSQKIDLKRIIVTCLVISLSLFTISNVYSIFKYAVIWPIICIIVSVFNFKFNSKTSFIADIVFPLSAAFVATYFSSFILIADKKSGFNSYLYFLSTLHKWNGVAEASVAVFIYFLFRLFFRDRRIAASVAPVIPVILGMINTYVYLFRRSELSFADVYSITTAVNVVSEYNLLQYDVLGTTLAPLLLNAFTAFSFGDCKDKLSFKKRSFLYLSLTIVAASFGGSYIWHKVNTSSVGTWGTSGTRNNGIICNLVISAKSLKVAEPNGYSPEDIQTYFENCSVESVDSELPNIIVIMNESFIDVTKYNDFWDDSYTDPMPYYHSLSNDKEHAYTGYAFSSIYGGLTSISEFEMLTGITTTYLTSGVNPYSVYIRDESYSMVHLLNNYGYKTVAMHPYFSSGWNRTSVYPYLGFDSMMFIDDFEYSGDDMIRNYMSDSAAYRNMINQFEINDEESDSPMFVFMVTMQNHGGYHPETLPDCHEFIPGYPVENMYANLINYSDIALEELLTYLSTKDEEYVVLMFGDHHPAIESFGNKFAPGQYGKLIPYIIWDNKGISSEISESHSVCEFSSVNYLGLETLEAARIPLSPYFQYIADIRDVVPSINRNVYFDVASREFIAVENYLDSESSVDAINRYRCIQYCYLIDKHNNGFLLEN